jgi:tetratricopeptide (TPR) repeat protein
MRQEAVEQNESFASPALGHRLLDRAESLLESNPWEAESLAQLGLAIGRRLSEGRTSATEADALLGRAWSLYGESFRQWGWLEPVPGAHRKAFRHIDPLPADCPERAGFCRYLSRFRRDQGRDDEALALLARALDLYEEAGDRQRAQGCRLELAWLYLDDLVSERALRLLERARDEEEVAAGGARIGKGSRKEGEDGTGRAEEWLSIRHGLALACADSRRDAAAGAILAEIREGPPEGRIDPLRLKQAEASVLDRMDRTDEAAELLFAAWTGYALRGEPVEAVLALLDLAQIRAERGEVQELERLEEGVGGLAGLAENLSRPVLDGLAYARDFGLVGVERLEALKAFARRARHNPAVRFEPVGEPASIQGGWEGGRV